MHDFEAEIHKDFVACAHGYRSEAIAESVADTPTPAVAHDPQPSQANSPTPAVTAANRLPGGEYAHGARSGPVSKIILAVLALGGSGRSSTDAHSRFAPGSYLPRVVHICTY